MIDFKCIICQRPLKYDIFAISFLLHCDFCNYHGAYRQISNTFVHYIEYHNFQIKWESFSGSLEVRRRDNFHDLFFSDEKQLIKRELSHSFEDLLSQYEKIKKLMVFL